MIKITFEFESVEEAAKFLTTGSMGKKTNAHLAALSDPSPTPQEDSDEKDKPLTPSERRKAARAGKAGSPTKRGSKKSGEPKVTRKTTSRSKGKKKDPAPVSDDISDADLSKAASTGAAKLTPNGVTTILVQFGASHVSELVGTQRKEFLDLIDEAIEEEK